jgi:hypothetical protein
MPSIARPHSLVRARFLLINTETLFCVEFVLNAPLYTLYLHELNVDDKSRNKLALDAETGLKSKPLVAEAHMRAAVAATVIKPVRLLCSYVSPRLEWVMWDVVRIVLASGALVAGAAHTAIRRGIAARVPSVLCELDAYLVRTAAKRDAVVALYKGDDMAVFMMHRCGPAMIARIFGNKNVCPRDLTENQHLNKVSANNDVVESMFGQTKAVHAQLEHSSLITASAVAAHQQAGTFMNQQESDARGKKRATKLGLNKVRTSLPGGPYRRRIDSIPEEKLDALLKYAVSKKGQREAIAEPLYASRHAQAQATLLRKQRAAQATKSCMKRKAAAFRAQITQPRAQSVAELDDLLATAASAVVAKEKANSKAKTKATTRNQTVVRKAAASRAKRLARRVEKAQRAVLVAQLRLRREIWSDDRSIPTQTVGGKPRSYAGLKRLVDEYIEAEPANRVVPIAPDVAVSTELASCVTDLALQLHIAREQHLQAARKEFYKAAPATRRVELAAGAGLPPPVESVSQSGGALAEAGLAAGACVWSGKAIYKIVDPYFSDATGAELVCLIYPIDAYEVEQEAAMKANPAAFEHALLCEHTRVLSWLGFVTADDADEDGCAEDVASGPVDSNGVPSPTKKRRANAAVATEERRRSRKAARRSSAPRFE